VLALTAVYSTGLVYSSEASFISNSDSVNDSTVTKIYTCPMHAEVLSDKPGECPKCGMDLILKETETKKDEKKDQGHEHKGHKGCMGH
jgi:Heavy metal binding domain